MQSRAKKKNRLTCRVAGPVYFAIVRSFDVAPGGRSDEAFDLTAELTRALEEGLRSIEALPQQSAISRDIRKQFSGVPTESISLSGDLGLAARIPRVALKRNVKTSNRCALEAYCQYLLDNGIIAREGEIYFLPQGES